MNGIEKITARIIADAEAEAAAVRADASARCEQVRGDYDKKAQDEYWRIVRSGVKDCEARVQRLGRTAEMEAKKSVLTLKQDMVSEAFDKAAADVLAMPEEKYAVLLASLAVKASESGAEEIVLSERDSHLGETVAKLANKALGERGKLVYKGAVRDIPGGVILREGDIEINSSLDTLISQYRYQLASQVAEVLFG